MIRAITIRIEGEQAAQLRTLWAAMKERHLPEPGKRLNRALRDELMNIALRWEDAICDSDILAGRAEESTVQPVKCPRCPAVMSRALLESHLKDHGDAA